MSRRRFTGGALAAVFTCGLVAGFILSYLTLPRRTLQSSGDPARAEAGPDPVAAAIEPQDGVKLSSAPAAAGGGGALDSDRSTGEPERIHATGGRETLDDAGAAVIEGRPAEQSPSAASALAPDKDSGGKQSGNAEPASDWLQSAIAYLRSRKLLLPVAVRSPETLRGMFQEARDGRLHEAVDLLAPRNTPVVAVEDGTIARLFLSKAGGVTIYQFDPSQQYVYYYAHLERYAEGLKEEEGVRRGETIGYVGTSGNAPPNTPHLHFAIFKLNEKRRWWEGTPIDPFEVFR